MIRAIRLVLRAPLVLTQLFLALVTAYLVLLTVASFFYRKRERHATTGDEKRIAVLIPAHNEAPVIGRLLASLAAVDYPRDRHEVFVVADNCTDTTAKVARSYGATVYERFDLRERGKGYALRWLLERVPLDDFDAVLVVDADAVASKNLLSVANDGLTAGYELAQVYDGVLNRDTSPAAGLRALAFDLHNYVRLLGTEALGASAGLMGNGMIIATNCLQKATWDAFGLAEDMEVHARLLRTGRRVHFLPDASVLAEMPNSLAASEGQNMRWEAGRLDVARRHGLPLIRSGLRSKSWVQVAAGLETLVPPQSVQVMLIAAGLLGGIVLRSRASIALGGLVATGQATYLALGAVQLRRKGAALRCLLHAPAYVAWKSLLYAKALSGRADKSWVRGARAAEEAPRSIAR